MMHLQRIHRAVMCSAGLLVAMPVIGAECATQRLPPFDVDAKAGPGWGHMPLSKLKRDTEYRVAREDGAVVLKAAARDAASAFVHLAKIDPARLPVIAWRWRVPALIEAADNTDPKREDAPARLIVGFDGDKSKLTAEEQRRFERARKLAGREPPYATLMYIWENRAAVDTVIPSAHSSRLKMIVVESGPQGAGAWRSYQRNLVEDFRRAFGEAPGRVLGVAVMTDTDNTNASAEGVYGEIRFSCAAASGR